ncbi:MAG: MscS Mechanosensitive ion channel:Conserved helix [Betaproteobacteria bacterium]|nr:MscS Mechanosensitive ion channel:Conserved helix [Betaproteobacteria bacterium]
MDNQLALLDQAKSTLVDLAIKFGPKLVVAIVIMIAGFYTARAIGRMFDRSIGRLQLEPPVRILLVRLLRLMIVVVFLIMALQNLGVELLPLIAGLGVAGAGIALAMQGVLGNLVAGFTIIFTRPFRVGEYISIVGVEGQIESIDLFATRLLHSDRSIVVVPNRKIVGEILHNYGRIRQLSLTVGIVRAADVDAALVIIKSAVSANANVLKEPAPVIGVSKLDTGSITLIVAPWVKVDDYVGAGGALNQAIVEKFAAGGIQYPAPAVAVRMANAQPVH